MNHCFGFDSKFFSYGENYPAHDNFQILFNSLPIPCSPECLFIYFPAGFRNYASGAKSFELKSDYSPPDYKNFLTILMDLTKNYKIKDSFMIPQNKAHSYQLIGNEFDNLLLKTAADESLLSQTSKFQLPPLKLFPYSSDDIEKLDKFSLKVNNVTLEVPKYLLYLISETIKEIILKDAQANETVINVTNHENLEYYLNQFQNLFHGNEIEICQDNLSVFKEFSEKLRIYQLRKACLYFEKKEKKQNKFYTLFNDDIDRDFLNVMKLECFSIIGDSAEFNLDQLVDFAVSHFIDLSNKSFFPRSFLTYFQDENQIRDICSKTFAYYISMNERQCDEIEEMKIIFKNATGESGNTLAQAKTLIGMSRAFEYSIGNQFLSVNEISQFYQKIIFANSKKLALIENNEIKKSLENENDEISQLLKNIQSFKKDDRILPKLLNTASLKSNPQLIFPFLITQGDKLLKSDQDIFRQDGAKLLKIVSDMGGTKEILNILELEKPEVNAEEDYQFLIQQLMKI